MSLAFAFAALALLRLGWLTPRAAGYVAAAALLLAMIAGLTLPDIDQPLPLDHRSAITHSALPALLVTFRRWAWPVASGLAFGIGLHLAADLFPNAMIGFATVKAPFVLASGRLWDEAKNLAALDVFLGDAAEQHADVLGQGIDRLGEAADFALLFSQRHIVAGHEATMKRASRTSMRFSHLTLAIPYQPGATRRSSATGPRFRSSRRR